MERLERSTFRLEGGDSIQLNYMGNKIILNSSRSTILPHPISPCQVLSSKPCTTFFHQFCQKISQFLALYQKNMLHNPEDTVPQEGVEPSRLAAAAFEVAVSTIPPPGHVCLYFSLWSYHASPVRDSNPRYLLEREASLTARRTGIYVVVNRF